METTSGSGGGGEAAYNSTTGGAIDKNCINSLELYKIIAICFSRFRQYGIAYNIILTMLAITLALRLLSDLRDKKNLNVDLGYLWISLQMRKYGFTVPNFLQRENL